MERGMDLLAPHLKRDGVVEPPASPAARRARVVILSGRPTVAVRVVGSDDRPDGPG